MSPLYDYECSICKAQRQDIRCIAQRHDGPRCHACSKHRDPVQMRLMVSPVKGIVKDPAVPRGS